MRIRIGYWAAWSVLAAGCGLATPPSSGTASSRQAEVVSNGRELNGRELNGRELNGRELNGRELNGTYLEALWVDGAVLANGSSVGLHLEGSELVGVTADGSLRGADLLGMVLQGDLGDGTTLPVRLDAVTQDAQTPDLWRYAASYSTTSGRMPACGVAADGTPVEAVVVAGRWNYAEGVAGGGAHLDDAKAVTLGCLDGAVGKCVTFGYAPWRSASICNVRSGCTASSLAPYHQACTRMVRADYCGDGRSFTVDGTLIDLYDAAGVQLDTEASWPFEAEWDGSGARCLVNTRIDRAEKRVDCRKSLELEDCGDTAHFSAGSLLMTKFQPSESSGADGSGKGEKNGSQQN